MRDEDPNGSIGRGPRHSERAEADQSSGPRRDPRGDGRTDPTFQGAQLGLRRRLQGIDDIQQCVSEALCLIWSSKCLHGRLCASTVPHPAFAGQISAEM